MVKIEKVLLCLENANMFIYTITVLEFCVFNSTSELINIIVYMN